MRAERERKRRVGYWVLLGVLGWWLAPATAAAVIVGGGGAASSDCFLVLSTAANTPSSKPKNVRCIDGDVSCDNDGIVNGVCEVQISVCANSTAISECTLVGVDTVVVAHAEDDGVDPDFDPDLQALQSRIDSQILDDNPNTNVDDCTTPASIRVPIKGPLGDNKCGRRTKTVRITTTSDNLAGKIYTDSDRLKISCAAAAESANGCNPQTLFSSTFDRMQKQIFNQSCAVSTCHDSNTVAANLLLESGASYNNIVDADPTNAAAVGLGLKRVALTGLNDSFLFHKVTGALPDDTFGGRMPLGRRRLHSSLQTVIQLWIEDGAPAMGWVPGTF